MAEKLGPKELGFFKELLISNSIQIKALIQLFLNIIRFSIVVMIIHFLLGGHAVAGTADVSSSGGGYSQGDIVLLITYVLMALVFSFLCSVAEAVLLSITPSYIAELQGRKPKRAALLKKLKQDNVDKSLAAILTLNTIAHTVGAIGSGSKATVIFGSAWFGLFSALMTLMILFLSEIIPKTIGALHWRSLAGLTAQFVQILIWVLYPLIWVSEFLTRLVSRGKTTHIFSREEFIAMADIGEQSGKIDQHESRIIQNLFRFGSLTSTDIMTPRTVISCLPQSMTVSEALGIWPPVTFSRIPLYQTDVDHITGFVLRDDLLNSKALDRGGAALETLKRNIKSVSGDMSLSALLEFFLSKRLHIAIVIDEYGGTKGVVTMEDVVETLLGMEIVDEMDQTEDMQALARRQWKKRAKAHNLNEIVDNKK
jgi:CBS domain containing-hemolysin-like protein